MSNRFIPHFPSVCKESDGNIHAVYKMKLRESVTMPEIDAYSLGR